MDVEGLYVRFAPMVLRRCRQLLKEEENALDAMHDVFMKLMKNRESLHDRHPSTLLYIMATRVCLDRLALAENRYGGGDELLLEIAAAEDLENQIEARNFLERLFHKQQESTQVIAVLHLLDGWTLSEVAEEVGMSISGVRKRLSALKGRLQSLVELDKNPDAKDLHRPGEKTK